jgi:serine/threonine-protein kinase
MIRFMHEAQIQARVVHPNICRIYDIESSEGTLKIAMQLIKGPNLEQAARQLTQDEAVAIVQQIAEAVHAAHRVNLIHRDLKPSNIILERSPEGGWVPYLVDFGLAVALGEPALTLSRAVLGTPAFMAPEQRQGDRDHVGPATDIYALGGTLHFALLGFPPSQTTGFARLASKSRTSLPRPLQAILGKCLQEDPALRYPTAAALAEDLARFRLGRPLQDQVQGRLPRASAFLPRPGRRLFFAASVLAILGLGFSGYQTHRCAGLLRSSARERAVLVVLGEDLANCAVHRALPPHDLRPSRITLRHHQEQLRSRRAEAPEEAGAATAFAIGRYSLLLGNYPEALQEFHEAWRLGFQSREITEFLAQAQLGILFTDAGSYPTALPLPEFQGAPGPCSTLLIQMLRKDFAAAAVSALVSEQDHRFLGDPGGLQTYALCALAQQRFQAGDLAGATQGYQEALTVADKRLNDWKSHESLTHARARAKLGLAEMALESGLANGTSARESLEKLKQDTDLALLLDPEAPALLEDWVAARFLSVLAQAARGGDPRPGLNEAFTFLEAQRQRDATPNLRTFRMLLHWQAAEDALRRGQQPGAEVLAAMPQGAGRTFLNRDYLGDLLLAKARGAVARGEDPRPALAELGARLVPGEPSRADWPALETAAEGALVRALWERGAGLDPSESLASTRRLAGLALAVRPGAARANAVKGLALAQEMILAPSRAKALTPAARQCLRAALAAGDTGPTLKRLTQELARCL